MYRLRIIWFRIQDKQLFIYFDKVIGLWYILQVLFSQNEMKHLPQNPAYQQEVERLLQVFGTTRNRVLNNTKDASRLFKEIPPEPGLVFSHPEPRYRWKSGMNTARKLGIIEKYKGSTWRVTSKVEDFLTLRRMLEEEIQRYEYNVVKNNAKQRQLIQAHKVVESWLDWLDDINHDFCHYSARVDREILAIAERNERRRVSMDW